MKVIELIQKLSELIADKVVSPDNEVYIYDCHSPDSDFTEVIDDDFHIGEDGDILLSNMED